MMYNVFENRSEGSSLCYATYLVGLVGFGGLEGFAARWSGGRWLKSLLGCFVLTLFRRLRLDRFVRLDVV